METAVILVTGAGGSAAYNFIDSLRLSDVDYTVIGVDIDKYHLGLSNADHRYLVPPQTDRDAYITALNRLVAKYRVQLIHPQPDPEVRFIGEYRSRLRATTFLPKQETIRICQDKLRTYRLLKQARVPVPETYPVEDEEHLTRVYKELMKTHETLWIRAIKGAGSKAALPIVELDHAKFWIDYWRTKRGIGYGDFMLAEFLPGREFAFQSVWKGGRLLVSQARERKEYIFGNLTASGQSSSPALAMTVERDDVNSAAMAAVKAVDESADGVYCVDLKENAAGTPCVIEINAGRFFTTSNFFSHAGCNMPDFYTKLSLGMKLPKYRATNNLKAGLHWVRMIDMGYKLIDSEPKN
jgi:predicted ATP-grasp superfamily ATP-dependent carboligase